MIAYLGIAMNTMIAYYSHSGHTEKVAKDLATRIGAKLERIEGEHEASEPGKSLSSLLTIQADIKPCKTDLADVDFLIVATPVWADGPSPYIEKYLSMVTNCRGKPFSAVIETRRGGGERTLSRIRKTLEKKGMRYVSSAFTFEKDVEAGAYNEVINRFASTIKKVV